METREMLAFGRFRREERMALSVAAEQAAFTLHAAESPEEAGRWLESHEALAMLLDTEASESLAVQTRSSARHARLPMIALSREIGDLCFNDAFSWGADDVLPLTSTRPLLTRLRTLPREAPTPPTTGRGTALVAETDQKRRTVVGRVLRNAGYSVMFAVTREDAASFAQQEDIALAVLNAELSDDYDTTIANARQAGSKANFIVCAMPRDLKAIRASLDGVNGVGVIDGYAPPENVLFASNELKGGAVNNRRSPRILYGTTVAFRGAGREKDDYGFSYNISEGGLYVRTLAPPEDDEVWVELCPPRSERRVRVVGKVAWRRRFNHNENATVPPGFGLSIVDGAKADIQAWNEAYRAICEALG
ncbi:MAG TPA: PilZ domain-containing protein [Polyangiaceae bacterium]|nr:PilZ domain-containing protein [Polyangiaceae bacterium]